MGGVFSPVFASRTHLPNASPYPLTSASYASRLTHRHSPPPSSNLNLNSTARILRLPVAAQNLRGRVRCQSSTSPRGPEPDENESKTILDAFFLGRALAETLTERVESTIGEILSTVGRLQAEQQKQVQEFQEEVFERAKRAKEKAAREATGEQGRLVVNPATATTNNYSASSTPPPPGEYHSADPTPSSLEVDVSRPTVSSTADDEERFTSSDDDKDPVSGVPIDE